MPSVPQPLGVAVMDRWEGAVATSVGRGRPCGLSLGGATRSLKKPVKGNVTAFSSFGESSSSFGGQRFLPKKHLKGQCRGLPFL